MRLKILVMPFSILLSLVLVIGFVRPDITVLQDKRVVLDTKTSQSQGMTALLSNIETLTSALEDQPESENLLKKYVPQALDQERVVDMFNYLASQSGVFVSSMDMKEAVVKSSKEEQNMAAAAEGVTPPAPSLKPKVKTYIATVEVKGGYEGVRDFLNRVSHMDRYHKVLNFSIEAPVGDSEVATPGVLTGRVQSQFDYFASQNLDSAMSAPVFFKGEFDTNQLMSLLKWISYSVPPLMQPEAGRPNPFQ